MPNDGQSGKQSGNFPLKYYSVQVSISRAEIEAARNRPEEWVERWIGRRERRQKEAAEWYEREVLRRLYGDGQG